MDVDQVLLCVSELHDGKTHFNNCRSSLANASRAGVSFPRFNLPSTNCQNLEQGHGFFGLFVALNILNDAGGFAILRDDQRLAGFGHFCNRFGRVVFEIADGFDLFG